MDPLRLIHKNGKTGREGPDLRSIEKLDLLPLIGRTIVRKHRLPQNVVEFVGLDLPTAGLKQLVHRRPDPVRTESGFGGDRQKLSDESLVRALLDRYPEEIGMTRIAPPHVYRYVGKKPEDWGVSGFVLIAESHISMHTFPERRLVWADIFSCKEFDAASVLEDLKQRFRLRARKI